MRIAIAHSPDSDDAFMFYGLASGKVPTGDLEIEHVLSDIESLNRAAFEGRYEISAVSFHAYTHLADRYILLPHGASMGDRYGPVVVAREPLPPSLDGVTVAIPGVLTTAFLALRIYKPDVQDVAMPFDQIQEAVHDGRVQAGLIIHEGQLTYASEGLHKVVDFGEWWADRTGGLPLPLGGNVIRRDLGPVADRAHLADAARQHRLRARSPRGGRSIRHAVRTWTGSREDGSLRRDVRERAHPRVRPARTRGRAPVAHGSGRERADA